MSNPVVVAITVDDHGDKHPAYIWWCPGCASFTPDVPGAGTHIFHVPPWTFDNNDLEHPSFSASYLSYGWKPPEDNPHNFKGAPRCHSFVKEGMIQYLDDSEHSLAGKTVPMVPVPDWLVHE